MTRIVAYPDGRRRLLANGEMACTTYSTRKPDDAARAAYGDMIDAADLMALALSEPILESSPADGCGGRMVTVRCGVFDGLEEDGR